MRLYHSEFYKYLFQIINKKSLCKENLINKNNKYQKKSSNKPYYKWLLFILSQINGKSFEALN